MYRFSSTTLGFYSTDLDYPNLPPDLVEISAERHAELMAAQSSGKQIVADDQGHPIAAERAVTVPASVTMRQARLALLAAGKLQAVSTAIAALPVPERDAAMIEWEYGASVDRSSALLNVLGAALSFTDEALDALFIHAAAL